eukprot:scaffold13613_cov114-Cylindrotheca_fusiformis.AAC.2
MTSSSPLYDWTNTTRGVYHPDPSVSCEDFHWLSNGSDKRRNPPRFLMTHHQDEKRRHTNRSPMREKKRKIVFSSRKPNGENQNQEAGLLPLLAKDENGGSTMRPKDIYSMDPE